MASNKKPRKARSYKGIVIEDFKHGGKNYKVGDIWETKHKSSRDYMINKQKIK